ncbi:MAG: lactonase family protein [Proteobacteria bacterium]|nr:lactonase family protein [Pseudomonadota bacterium]
MSSVAYVSHAGSGEIRVLRLADGALAEIQRVDVGGSVMPIAIAPGQRFLYVARRSEPLEVLTCAIDPATGLLDARGHAPLPDSMAYLATDRSGRFLFGASYGGHRITVSPIDGDGVAQPAQQVLATGRHAHAIRPDPTNRHVYSTSLGGDHIACWRFDAATGALSPNEPAQVAAAPGSGPRHFVWNGDATRLTLLCELDATLRVFDRDVASGALQERQSCSLLPPGFAGKPWAADLRMTPDGRHLVASERTSSTLAVFAVDVANGVLALRGHVATATTPRSIAIDPTGHWLIAAGQDADAVALHAFDPASGTPDPARYVAVGRQPAWVEFIALG